MLTPKENFPNSLIWIGVPIRFFGGHLHVVGVLEPD